MTVHVGLIGGGNISGTHARAASAIPDVKISAVYGTNHEKVARLGQEFGGRDYHDLPTFLSHRPMQMVIIASPSGLPAGQGIAAARQGLAALVQEPIEITRPPS